MQDQDERKACNEPCNCAGRNCIRVHDHCDRQSCQDIGCFGACKLEPGHEEPHWCSHGHAF